MSNSRTVYGPSDYFYLDLISYSIFHEVASQEKFKENLILRGSHLTRSLLYGFGDANYKFCRNPKDIDFFFHTPDDLIPEANIRDIKYSNRRTASQRFQFLFYKLMRELVEDLTNMNYAFKFDLDPVSAYSAGYDFQGEVSVMVKLENIRAKDTWPDDPYPSQKVLFDAVIEVKSDIHCEKRTLEFSIDVGSGDPIVCPPTAVSVVFPGLSPRLVAEVSGVTVSVLTSFKFHSSMETDFDWRVKDFYDLDLLIPHVDPIDSHFKANLYLAFASRGDKPCKVKSLLGPTYDSYLYNGWYYMMCEESLDAKRTKFEPVMKRLASFLRQTINK